MFLIIPTGHETTIRRIPWVTAWIVIACTAVQLASTLFGPSVGELEQVTAPLYAIELADKGLTVPDAISPIKVPADPKARAALRDELEAKLAALRRHDPAYLLAYRDGSGVSLRLLTSAFAHGGWLHLAGNMLFLYLCGCNLEDRWGRKAFLAFYLAGALVSASFSALVHRHDHAVSLGASGAIAACMGAFLVFYATTDVSFAWVLWITMKPKVGTFRAKAYWAVGVWLLLQLVSFWFEARGSGSGVGYSAHVAGFAFGAFGALALKRLGYDTRLVAATEAPPEWEEAPEVIAALALRHQGRDAEALAAFKALRLKLPRHETVLHELYELGLGQGDREAVEATASDLVVGLVRRGESVDALDRLAAIEAQFPQPALTDRALAGLARAAFDLQRNELGVDLTRRLMTSYPKSPVVAAALVTLARAQLRAGHAQLARKTLEQIVARYPLDPFAREAELLLASAAARAPIELEPK